jgi:hypothetical protein
MNNFPLINNGALGMDRITRNRLGSALPKDSELLDVVTTTGRSFQLLNILNCCDCLDDERSEWFSLPMRAHVGVTRFAFRRECLSDSSLFKIKAALGQIFVSSGIAPAERDFKAQYELLGLRGLFFREVWNDEGDSIPTVDWAGAGETAQ